MLKSWLTANRLKWLGLAMVMFGLAGNVWLITGFRNARAADCDDNAVIRCGVSSESTLQQKCADNANNTQAIFQAFGIDCGALNGLVLGRVTSSNDVYVQNASGRYDLVANNAMTAGRQRMAASDTSIAGGAAFRRPPSESFVSSPLSALVKMDGSKFLFAVIMSCGNPVTAIPTATPPPPQPTPPPKTETPPPSYEINKRDRLSGQSDWVDTVIAKPNENVLFRLDVKNTGQTGLDNVAIKDTLPGGLTFVDGSLVADGVKYKENITTSGFTIPHMNAGQTVIMTFVTTAQDVDACNDKYLTNTGSMQPPNLPPKSDTATVQICKPNEKIVTQLVSTTPPKTVLPSTGPDQLAAVFVVTTVGAAAAYQFYLRKRAF